MNVYERFFNKVDVTDGCWTWTGAIQSNGYGSVSIDGRVTTAHRAAYKLLVGDPGELPLDHLCRNRPCVNVAHLEPVTPRENARRGYGPSGVNSRRTECIHGHPLIGDNVIHRRTGARNCKACHSEVERRRVLRRKGEANHSADAR